jgi:hypothetical protein
MREYEIFRSENGSWGESDEHWTLVALDNGEPVVRYERSSGNPNGGGVKRWPPEITTVSDFLAQHTFGTLHNRLTALLREKRITVGAHANAHAPKKAS